MKTILFALSLLTMTASLSAQIPGTPTMFKAKKDKAVVTTLDCAGATHNGALGDGVPAAGVSSIIAYTGGNGETYSAKNISSTGVTGLTATLTAGTLNVGAGTLTFDITGTPDGMGIASFAISFGGQSCDLERGVGGLGEIPGNSTCEDAIISVTPCSTVTGASLNDDVDTADGTEYDWTAANDYMPGGTPTIRALVEIGGQCWYRRNADNIPSTFDPVPAWVNDSDEGWSGYYTGGPFAEEGRLYQWRAAMNDSTAERAQGVCAPGWHVPSDCEIMYLENTLGMSVEDQENTAWRGSGNVGSKLSTETSGATNSSGFTAWLGAYRDTNGTFPFLFGMAGYWWSSSEASTTNAQSRDLSSTKVGVYRENYSKAFAFSVRCLKN